MAFTKTEVQPDVSEESEEHLAEMARIGAHAVDGGEPAPAEPVEIAEKPEGIPDKFYNAETGIVDYTSLAKSYVELEKSRGVPDAPKPVEAPQETVDAEAAVKSAGLDLTELSAQYAEDGDLSDASYDALGKAGIDKDTVDAYIEGRKAVNEIAQTQAYSITDGAEGYAAMIDWATANNTDEETVDYNTAVNSRDSKARQAAVKGLWTAYESATGSSASTLITNTANTKTGATLYNSRAELMKDMNDPRYKTDEAYRAKVSTKLGNSNIM